MKTMTSSHPLSSRSPFWLSVKEIFGIFFLLGRKARKTKVFYLLSLLPVLMAAVIKFAMFFHESRNVEFIYVFNDIIMAFYLQFLILILALFFGTSVCSEELEGKTLTYLTTRPVSKSAVILGKYGAYTMLIIIMTVVGMVCSFLILNVEHLLEYSLYKVLFRDLAVLILGLICYTAFFTFLGTLFKKSIMFGFVFGFGWESVIQYFPGSTQKFAIAHYLKSLLPPAPSGRFSFLLVQLERSSPLGSILMLLLITAFFLGLTCLLFNLKEFILED